MFLAATFGGIMALIFWGLSDYLAGKSGQDKDEYLTTFIVQIATPLLLLPLVLLHKEPIIIGASFFVVILSALFFAVAYVSFVRALTIGPFGVAAPIGNSYALITLIIGVAFLQLQISLIQFFSLLIIIIGVVLLSVEKKAFNYKELKGSALPLAMVTMFFWGIAFVLIDIIIDVYPWYQLLFLLGVFMCLFTFSYYLIVHKSFPKWETMKYKNMTYAWKGGLALAVGSIAFYLGAGYSGSVVIPAVVASASPLVTSLMAHIKDKEKLSVYKRIGALVIVLGLMLLNIL
jgi:drug/metabolite transporter (DMT)-like permease